MENFNLSYSAWSLYKTCQLQFYYQYIVKFRPTDVSIPIYGLAGNVVHKSIEEYNKTGQDVFDESWKQKGIDNLTGIKGAKLSSAIFKKMFKTGNEFLEQYKDKIILIEKEFNGLDVDGFNIRSFIDIIIDDDKEKIFMDWKTNSTHSYEMHKDQILFYSWVCLKKFNMIPICRWVYLKHKDTKNKVVTHDDKFSVQEMERFDITIKKIIAEIRDKDVDIDRYDVNNYTNPFNVFYTLCRDEEVRRLDKKDVLIKLIIKGNFVFLEGDIHPTLLQGLDFATKFDTADKIYKQKKALAMAKKHGYKVRNFDEIGTIHIVNIPRKCFPIGLLNRVKKLCHEYASHYSKNMELVIEDWRNKEVMEQVLNIYPDKLLSGKRLRPYQQEAVDVFLEKKFGIINLATSLGKTITAIEIMRKVKAKTLWIIDRKELLLQTKKVIEENLGFEIGIISDGKVDIKDVTIATIQTLNSRLKTLVDYLISVNFVCVDEYQHSPCKSYQTVFAKLANTKYRMGLTATPWRDDGMTELLFSLVDEVVYKMTTEEGYKQGYLAKPKIKFIDMSEHSYSSKEYKEDYTVSIIENSIRNDLIIALAKKNKKKLIIVRYIKHGNELKKKLIDSEYIHGTSKNREQVMENFRNNKFNTLIISIQIGAEGLDIPDLEMIINAAANKGDGKSIQILGRALRLCEGKTDPLYYDFIDCGFHTNKHSQKRINIFKKEGHDVEMEVC